MPNQLLPWKEIWEREEYKEYQILTNIPIMYFVLDTEGMVKFVNAYGAEQLGYSTQDLQQSSFFNIFPPEEKRKTFREFYKCKSNPGEYFSWQFQKICKDGSVIRGEDFAKYIDSPAGSEIHIASTIYVQGEIVVQNTQHYQKFLESTVEKRTHELRMLNKLYEKQIKESFETQKKLEDSYAKLRNLSAHLEKAQENERIRISRELHDELGQNLSILRAEFELLKKKLPAEQQAAIEGIATSLDRRILDTISTVQNICKRLRPAILDNLGLVASLDWMAEEIQNTSGLKCNFSSNTAKLELPQESSIALFRICQEALTNILRHAQATQATITLTKLEDRVRISIADNGIGIRKDQINNPMSFGLIGLRERIHFLNGRTHINGVPGKGTTITAILPA